MHGSKMMLQPLAENAILHGLSGVQDGRLTVTARESGGVLEICVLDNGCGFPAEMLGAVSGAGAADRALRTIQCGYDFAQALWRSFGLRLGNRKDGAGACITARLPARRRDADAAGAGC